MNKRFQLPQWDKRDPVEVGLQSFPTGIELILSIKFFPYLGALTYAKAGLKAHNILRKIHGSPPLTLSQDLAKQAQKRAQKIMMKGQMEHNKLGHGENMLMHCNKKEEEIPADEATLEW